VLVAVMARMTGGKEKMNLADEMSKCPGFVLEAREEERRQWGRSSGARHMGKGADKNQVRGTGDKANTPFSVK